MSWTIIVASGQGDQLEELMNGAQEIAARINSAASTLVMEATSVEEVIRKRQRGSEGRAQLLIVAAPLPRSQSRHDPRGRLGVGLIKAVAHEAEPPACILVSERIEDYSAVQGMCEWLVVNSSTNYVDQCVELARNLGVVPAEPSPPPRDDAPPDADAPKKMRRVRSPSIARSPIPKPPAFTAAKRSARRAQRADGGTYALVDVVLPRDARCATMRLEIRKPGQVLPKKTEFEELNLDQGVVEELITKSKDLKIKLCDEAHWQADYQAFGELVTKLFWHNNPRFGFLYGMANALGDGNVRLRFNLERPLFDGLWEAMFDSFSQRHFMLGSTITRRARQSGLLNPFSTESVDTDELATQIGTDQRDLNILVIKSDVPDASTPEGPDDPLWKEYWESCREGLPKRGLEQLEHLDDEAKVLQDLRSWTGTTTGGTAPPRVKVDVLALPERPDKPWSLADQVEGTLRRASRRYDIVHFAGHALFDDEVRNGDGRGYLVFSGHPQPRAVTVAEVATWLKDSGVQLVYLSCCRSSAAAAALELARNNVPMTIGFSWDLDDKKAVLFAKRFYEALLTNDLKVCHAMNQARLNLFNLHGAGDPIWASPVLVAQPMEWIEVEGVLRPRWRERRPPSPPRAGRVVPRRRPPVPEGVQPSVPLHS